MRDSFGLCLTLFLLAIEPVRSQTPAAHYTGSAACRSCHVKQYEGWKQTRMANVIRSPKEHPEAVLGDFTKPNPLVTFTLDQVAFVYGSRYKQRYFTKIGDDFYVFPAQWDIAKKRWLPYHADKNAYWWTAFYPDSNLQRPTGPLCDGCHSVNYHIDTHQVTEWNTPPAALAASAPPATCR